MLVNTRCFGEIDLDEDKIINFEQGLMGFESYKKYAILYDVEKEQTTISWFQSLEEPGLALPVIYPHFVMDGYNPIVEDEILESLGEWKEEDLIILLTVAIPEKIEDATVNLKAPIIINASTRKACQVIVSNPEYVVKYRLYDAVQNRKKEGGQ